MYTFVFRVLIPAVYKQSTHLELHFFNNSFDDEHSKGIRSWVYGFYNNHLCLPPPLDMGVNDQVTMHYLLHTINIVSGDSEALFLSDI